MGSEGYFINQFLVTHTNKRTDGWGGSYANRIRLPVEIVRRTREAVGEDFIIIYRLSMLDLIPDGGTWEEAVTLAKAISAAGATIINTGIGWHEARVPTIATSVPRGAFTWVTRRMRAELRAEGIDIPLVTTNRINTPEVAEQVLAEGYADMISMARPLLADAFFVTKAQAGRADRINTCIACNQACLDHAFRNKRVSCLVNPRAGPRARPGDRPDPARKRIAVVGAGPGRPGRRHHARRARSRGGPLRRRRRDRRSVQPRAADPRQGGVPRDPALLRQPDPGHRRPAAPVARVSAEDLTSLGVDEVVLATGVTPRDPSIPGQDGSNVVSYIDVLAGGVPVGERVAIVGAGGIGFDVAEFLVVAPGESPTLDLAEWRREWGVGDPAEERGGLVKAQPVPATRKVTLLQRKRGKLGAGLGKTTGWIHRSSLVAKGVTMLPGSTTSGSQMRDWWSRSGRSTSASASSRPTRSCSAPGRSRCASSSRSWSRRGSPCT